MTKNKVNPAYKSKYADLGAIIEEAGPIVAKHGLAVTQAPTIEYQSNGDVDTYVDVLITTILHTSGQYIQFPTPLRIASNANAQAYGSAVTYMKRYAYCAVLNIATEDDDGEAAKNAAPEPTKSRPAPMSKPVPMPTKEAPTYRSRAEWEAAQNKRLEALPDGYDAVDPKGR